MNFLSLKYFLEVYAERNISKAAEKMNISQQGLSNTIIKLEKELGVSLFDRKNSLAPTYAGERLYALAQEIEDLEQQIYAESSDISGKLRSKLRIGISYTCGHAVLPIILPKYYKLHPMSEIVLMEGNSSELETWLSRDEIDFMIGFNTDNVIGAENILLNKERLVFAIPERFCSNMQFSRNSVLNTLSAESSQVLSGQPFILLKEGNIVRTMFDNYAAKNRLRPDIIVETENSETAVSLASEGMGITVFSELFLESIFSQYLDSNCTLRFFAVDNDEYSCRFSVSYMCGKYMGKAERDFLEICRSNLGNGAVEIRD